MTNRNWQSLSLDKAASLPVDEVLAALEVAADTGLASGEVVIRRAAAGRNVLRSHVAGPWSVFLRQLHNPLLILLVSAAAISFFTGDHSDSLMIFIIVVLSIGLGFINEYRSEMAVAALHSAIRHLSLVMRDGHPEKVDVVDLVPGDVVSLGVGDVVPADVRLVECRDAEFDEAVLTGESVAVAKTVDVVEQSGASPRNCALMGTVVRSGSARGVVVRTGATTAFGRIAARLGERQPSTAFQIGLAQFSGLLVKVAAALCVSIFIINGVFRHSLLEALLFSLAIAIGITPQLLPAIVTVSLSTGARHLAQRRVIVKRLVTIEDLGNITVLFTDKTGTLTEGQISFRGGIAPDGAANSELLRDGLICNEAIVEDGNVIAGNALDSALWRAAIDYRMNQPAAVRLAAVPFDHERRLASVLVKEGDMQARLITKGAPETVLARCNDISSEAQQTLEQLFSEGMRVVALATKSMSTRVDLTAEDETGLTLLGFLTFADQPKADAKESLRRLADLGIDVKVITGDNATVATKVCNDLDLPEGQTLDGDQLARMSASELLAAIPQTRVFARVSPEQKSQIINAQRQLGQDVAFLGDGVNDAVALHDADVGISVEGASEVATDAADIVLLQKDLGVLADGVVEGRRIFANTIKYVLMATSSNFGNMFSAAGASVFLKFLPMLPGQILLNNLLYDFSQISIPTDRVDESQLRRPSAWDLGFIRRFMTFFGPISSLFDFTTFAVMILLLHLSPDEFRSGWFMESLCTQTLIIFVIRTRRIPFWKSAPSTPLLVCTVGCACLGVLLPYSPLASMLGFSSLPGEWLLILAGMVVAYLFLCELGKWWFYRAPRPTSRPVASTRNRQAHLVHGRAVRFNPPNVKRHEHPRKKAAS